MKVLVTGGAGFQGSNLCRALLDRGDQVTILNTYSDRSEANLERFGLQDATVVWGSITDPQIVAKTVRGHDLVCHLAANIHVDESRDRPGDYYRTNVMGTYNVAEACREHGAPLFHVSTCEVYGGCDRCPRSEECQCVITESCPLKPQSPYGASKAAADRLVYAHAATYRQRVLIVRPGNVFGPGQRHDARGAVIPIFVDRALQGEPIYIYGDGRQARDFIFVDDLAIRYLRLLDELLDDSTENARTINIGTRSAITIRHLAELIIDVTSSSSPIFHDPPRPGEVSSFVLASLHGSRILSGHDFRSNLKAYVDWFRANELQEACPCSA